MNALNKQAGFDTCNPTNERVLSRGYPIEPMRLGRKELTRLLVRERDGQPDDRPGAITVDRKNWVWMLVDNSNIAISKDGRFQAFRAITRRGRLIWYVFQHGKKFGYHSRASTPEAAFEDTRRARERRRQAFSDWATVEKFAADLRHGRVKQDVRRADGYAAATCDEGVDRFMELIGAGKSAHVNGRLIGWLMLVEKQIGLVLHATMMRAGRF